jgi:uncharacterized protein (TIGR02145 family)
MKKKNRILLIGITIAMILAHGCVKDETTFKTDPVITWSNPADISVGTILSGTQLNATADVSGNFVYTPPLGTKLNVGANQDLRVDFTPTYSSAYNNVSKTVKINVTAPVTISDIDGNVYHTVTIGTQVWMVENLKVTHYRNGDIIPNIIDQTQWDNLTTGAYCNYGDISTYGRLYNWYAVSDNRNIAPAGWHVPSETEWTTLINYLGGASVACNKLREPGDAHWKSLNTGATNQSGFTALPGGFRIVGETFEYQGDFGLWATSTFVNDVFMAVFSYVQFETDNKAMGISVRCVKDRFL